MYTNYFGLSDVPFSIAPDPDYLFMSDRHREALSHLTYGLGTTGGFVLLTGEVGTGKTTISRHLMAQLPENTQTAFILNPTLSSQELLATICDELKIRYRKTGATLKTLTDKIQEKLLKNHEKNINTLLIIDEAQHLQAEVLEQLRLLTNLETNTKKLLQVILIGQPELQQLLQRRDLRQLAQRITARYHLMPLNKQEVAQYIQHRLSVADCYRAVFDKGAVAMIHQLSQGIPRLINLLCDRSLWLAYDESKSVINKKIVIKASTEALGATYQASNFWQKPWFKAAAVLMLISSGVLAGMNWQQFTALPKVLTSVIEPSEISSSLTASHDPTKSSSKESKAAKQTIKSQEVNNAAQEQTKPLVRNENKDTELLANNKSDVATKSAEPIVLGYKSEEYKQKQQNKSTKKQAKLTVQPIDGVSADLFKNFQQAVNDTEQNETMEAENIDVSQQVNKLTEMPLSFQNALPNLKFEMHIYASDGKGWIRVNGKDVHEGEPINSKVRLIKILPQQVILSFQGEQFSMPALSSW